jgi:hypothetical protein
MLDNISKFERPLNITKVFIQVLLFMILPPVVGLPYAIYTISHGVIKKEKTDYFVFFICIAFYLAAINATKIPGGDQVNYYVAYMNVPIKGFWYSLCNIYGLLKSYEIESTQISGEFMNGIYNYVGYYLTFGYYPLFEFLFTAISYLLLFTGLYRFCSTLSKPHVPIVCGVLIIAFFYLYFQYTLHIQKQFFAQAIMMYVIGNYAYYGKLRKKDYIAIICSVFTHQSMLFFVPFVILKRFRKKMTTSTSLFVLLIFAILIFYGPRMLGGINVDGDSALSHGVGRFVGSEGKVDLSSSLVFSQVLVIALPMAYTCVKRLLVYKKHFIASQSFLVIVASLLLVAVLAMSNQPLSQYRFFMMLIAFIPFIFPLLLDDLRMRNKLLKFLAGLMIVWFFVQFSFIIWDYASEWQILFCPPSLLIVIGNAGLIY